MSRKSEIARQYLKYLEAADLQALQTLFAVNGTVDSPLYGHMEASRFYERLFADSEGGVLTLNGIFEETRSNRLALYFSYKWTLVNNQVVEFDVVDIITFNEADKILNLRIIYDTVQSRELVDALRQAGANHGKPG